MNVENAQLSMNIFDAIILGVLVLSTVIAFFRGFVREILSLGAWVGAGLITIYLFPQSTQLMKGYVKSDHVAAGGAALGTYLCALMTLSLINAVIIKYVKTGSEVGIIDNALGMGFGAIRGAFIVSLAYLLISAFVSSKKPEDEPKWLKGSVTKPYLNEGAQVLARMAPKYLSNFEEILKKQKANGNGVQDEAEEGLEDAKQEAGEAVDGSKATTRRALDRIINSGEKYKEDIKNERR